MFWQACIANGAVAFIRTNIPQTMMSLSSHNPIYGLTRNPFDPSRSPGGSSAGEGAAIGSGASMFGLGSDIGMLHSLLSSTLYRLYTFICIELYIYECMLFDNLFSCWIIILKTSTTVS